MILFFWQLQGMQNFGGDQMMKQHLLGIGPCLKWPVLFLFVFDILVLLMNYWYWSIFQQEFPLQVLFYVLWIVICYMTDDWTFCHAMFKNHRKAECFPFYSGNTKTSKKYSSKLTLVTCLKIDLTFITNITVRLKKKNYRILTISVHE